MNADSGFNQAEAHRAGVKGAILANEHGYKFIEGSLGKRSSSWNSRWTRPRRATCCSTGHQMATSSGSTCSA